MHSSWPETTYEAQTINFLTFYLSMLLLWGFIKYILKSYFCYCKTFCVGVQVSKSSLSLILAKQVPRPKRVKVIQVWVRLCHLSPQPFCNEGKGGSTDWRLTPWQKKGFVSFFHCLHVSRWDSPWIPLGINYAVAGTLIP